MPVVIVSPAIVCGDHTTLVFDNLHVCVCLLHPNGDSKIRSLLFCVTRHCTLLLMMTQNSFPTIIYCYKNGRCHLQLRIRAILLVGQRTLLGIPAGGTFLIQSTPHIRHPIVLLCLDNASFIHFWNLLLVHTHAPTIHISKCYYVPQSDLSAYV